MDPGLLCAGCRAVKPLQERRLRLVPHQSIAEQYPGYEWVEYGWEEVEGRWVPYIGPIRDFGTEGPPGTSEYKFEKPKEQP